MALWVMCCAVVTTGLVYVFAQLRLRGTALTIWIWQACRRGQLTVTAHTLSPFPRRARKSLKESKHSLESESEMEM